MTLSGFTTGTLTETLIGPAVVYRGAVPWGVSRGGVRVEPIREIREVEFDGRRAPVAGLDRVVSYGLRITGTFLEWNVLHAQRHEAGVTATVAAGNSTITPRDADELFPDGAYVSDLSVWVRQANGTLVGFRMPKAHVVYSIASEDKGEAGIGTVLEARADLSEFGTEDAPYTIEFDTSGAVTPPAEDDVHLELIDALGGDSEVLAFYVTSNGVTGLADASVEHSGGVVDEWNDYRGGAFAPLLAGVGSERPAWDAGTLEIVGDGVDDRMATAANAIFDLATAKTVISVAVLANNEFSATIADDATSRYLGIAQIGLNIAAKSSGGNLDSGVPLSATRRVIFSSSNGTTTLASEVPNHARQTFTITEIPSGSNKLFAFTYGPSPANTSSAKVKAMIVLNREYTTGDRDLIRDWAITNLGAVAAS